MIGGSSPLAAVLTVVSVMCLSLLAVLCLRCKKKSKIIHEEHQIYNPQMFQRGGSVFAVTRSKTVTRANQITSITVETQEEFEDFSTATAALDEQPNYQNISNAETGSVEHTYVAPLAISVYENEQCTIITDADQIPGVYANTHTSSSKEDEDDYENAEYLHQVVQEENDDEPEYVNEIC
ncbi:LAT2 domain-containing protein isoform X1 [Pseudoliparis swirei]|uniref:LAT2 domain-containing protein isoform X1 n=1 Tax=Pseudoliparis swirei TaxID=2059687 RepID=UPI0024BDE7EC|nr:LAT2 domain-containing protein isoform X1 [Pseudoliparis swirei]